MEGTSVTSIEVANSIPANYIGPTHRRCLNYSRLKDEIKLWPSAFDGRLSAWKSFFCLSLFLLQYRTQHHRNVNAMPLQHDRGDGI